MEGNGNPWGFRSILINAYYLREPVYYYFLALTLVLSIFTPPPPP